MQTTSHTRMRTRRHIVTDDGGRLRTIRMQRPGRCNDRRRWIAESAGWR